MELDEKQRCGIGEGEGLVVIIIGSAYVSAAAKCTCWSKSLGHLVAAGKDHSDWLANQTGSASSHEPEVCSSSYPSVAGFRNEI